MKAKFIIAMIVVIAALATWNIKENKSEVVLSDLALANVEALAQGGELVNPGGAVWVVTYTWEGSFGNVELNKDCKPNGGSTC